MPLHMPCACPCTCWSSHVKNCMRSRPIGQEISSFESLKVKGYKSELIENSVRVHGPSSHCCRIVTHSVTEQAETCVGPYYQQGLHGDERIPICAIMALPISGHSTAVSEATSGPQSAKRLLLVGSLNTRICCNTPIYTYKGRIHQSHRLQYIVQLKVSDEVCFLEHVSNARAQMAKEVDVPLR